MEGLDDLSTNPYLVLIRVGTPQKEHAQIRKVLDSLCVGRESACPLFMTGNEIAYGVYTTLSAGLIHRKLDNYILNEDQALIIKLADDFSCYRSDRAQDWLWKKARKLPHG